MKAQNQALLRAVNSLREISDIVRTLEVNDRIVLDATAATEMSEALSVAFVVIQIGLAVLKAEGVDTTASH